MSEAVNEPRTTPPIAAMSPADRPLVREIKLGGCGIETLAHYLKSLGVFRLFAEQCDGSCRAVWRGNTLALQTNVTKDELLAFFANDYVPTPIISPWNGRAGFLEGEESEDSTRMGPLTVGQVLASGATRLQPYREVLAQVAELEVVRELNSARSELKQLEAEKKAKLPYDEDRMRELKVLQKALKARLLTALRARLPEIAVEWLDASWVLTSEESPDVVPLLGAGGCEGSMDFSINHLARLLELFDSQTGVASVASQAWLESSIFGTSVPGLSSKLSIGRFLPAMGGGDNATAGFRGASNANLWDFAFLMEGALLFAAAAVRRLGAHGNAPSAPFTVRPSGVGYGSAHPSDEGASKAELWLPLWSNPASLSELRALFTEGRSTIGRRPARNGIDFARALTTLGIDRGVSEFHRFGVQQRNGLSDFVIPLGRYRVQRRMEVDLLLPLDRWLDRFIGRAKSDKAPNAAGRAARNLEDAILRLTQRGKSELQAVLLALGECEAAMASSFAWASDPKSAIRPVPPLEETWLHEANDGSVEYRIAASVAALRMRYRSGSKSRLVPLRAHLSPIVAWEKEKNLGVKWDDKPGRDVLPAASSLVDLLVAVLERRLLLAVQAGHSHYSEHAPIRAALGDVAAFVEGRTDDARITKLLRALMLIDWPSVPRDSLSGETPHLAP
ncbi:MAG: type I-U CRISPR-associated protein Csx17, partial [Myxococcales bacterium]|nr:type I-U CRISPR-associated protein Csx17 [Myxococcales bacterium]